MKFLSLVAGCFLFSTIQTCGGCQQKPYPVPQAPPAPEIYNTRQISYIQYDDDSNGPYRTYDSYDSDSSYDSYLSDEDSSYDTRNYGVRYPGRGNGRGNGRGYGRGCPGRRDPRQCNCGQCKGLLRYNLRDYDGDIVVRPSLNRQFQSSQSSQSFESETSSESSTSFNRKGKGNRKCGFCRKCNY